MIYYNVCCLNVSIQSLQVTISGNLDYTHQFLLALFFTTKPILPYDMSLRHSHIIAVHNRDETILQYIDILQYLLQQYNTIRLKTNSNILHIAIYCDILQYIAMFVVLML